MMLLTIRLTQTVFTAVTTRRLRRRSRKFDGLLSPDGLHEHPAVSRVFDEVLFLMGEGLGERDDVVQRLEGVGGRRSRGNGGPGREPGKRRRKNELVFVSENLVVVLFCFLIP